MSSEIRLNPGSLTVSASPHIRCKESIAKIMWAVNAALVPAAIFSIYRFGVKAAVSMTICIATAVLTKYLIQKWQKRL